MKAVLFDLDGTLTDSGPGITKSTQYALAKMGIDEPDLKKLECFIGPPLVDSFQKYYGMSEKEARQATEAYRERYNPTGCFECTLYPHVEETLRDLKEKGYWIGIASSKPEHMCRKILDHFGILELFCDVIGATPDGRIDSKEEVLQEVFRRFPEFSKKEMCLVGDTIFDVEGAKACGLACIGVSYGFGDIEAMKKAGAVCICDSMKEIPSAVEKLL